MNVFESVSANAKAILSEWVQVKDPRSNITIQTFKKKPVDETKTNGHCWKCVSINKCWFKNEKGKKPAHFNYKNYSFTDIPLSKRGLYHPRCHDKEYPINVPKLNQIVLLKLRSNFNDFFKRKKGIFYGLGYTYKDEEELMQQYINQVKTRYRYGDYVIYQFYEYGFQINIKISISGKNQYKHIEHSFKTGLIIFPEGQLKIATIFAGRIS